MAIDLLRGQPPRWTGLALAALTQPWLALSCLDVSETLKPDYIIWESFPFFLPKPLDVTM